MTSTIISSIVLFLGVSILLVVILLVAKKYLVPSGKATITINNDKQIEVETGSSLLSTLSNEKIFLPSACGGGGSCAQCRCQVLEGGGEILPTEQVHFSRKQQLNHWRLGCQVKVKNDMKIIVPESVLGVKEWECEVISNKNVATFIKEFIVALPPGEHMNFIPGSYAQIKIPAYTMDYDKDIDKSLIGDEYLPSWEKFGLFGLKCKKKHGTYDSRLFYGKLSGRRRSNHVDGAYRHATVQTETAGGLPRCDAGYRLVIYLYAETGRQSYHERPLRRFPPHIRLQKRNDVDRRRCRYGSIAVTNHAHDQDASYDRPEDVLFLRSPSIKRSILPTRFLGSGKRVPQLLFPFGTRPPRSRSRCGRS